MGEGWLIPKVLILFITLIILNNFIVQACISDLECKNQADWYSYGDNLLAREKCTNGVCVVAEIKQIQGKWCVTNQDCYVSGQICVGGICQNKAPESTVPIDYSSQISNGSAPYIIGGAVLLGFIILAIILVIIFRRRRK